jgi:4-hydroxy-tetrahydrodipicolinate synthase
MKKIIGPVVPIPALFDENENLDLKSTENYVKFLVDSGIKNIMTTVGTSRFNLLSKEEIKQFNEVVVKSCGDKAISIIANPPYGPLKDAIEFAKHTENIGADVFLLFFPDRNYGDDLVVDFFKTVCNNISLDVIIHEMPLRNGVGGGQVQYSVELLDKLFEIENIIGMKEESLDINHSSVLIKKYAKDKTLIGAGGGMSRYLRDYWLGSDTYLAGIGNFQPEIELEFFDNMQNEKYKEAYSLVHDVELPYFQTVVPMGWHISLKEALELRGLVASSAERLPLKRISKENREILKKTMTENGWL